MAIIASMLARIKSDPITWLGGAERINEVFMSVGHRWRERALDPARTIGLFILQILHDNTAISALRHLSSADVADSSYCDARSRLPVEGVAAVVEQLSCQGGAGDQFDPRWLGRRVVMADATTVAAPDTGPLQELWPQPSAQKQGCGFPVIKLLGLMNALNGMILQLTIMSLKVHEFSQAVGMEAVLRVSDVLLADRGLCSFVHLAMLSAASVDAVFRMHQGQNVDFTPHRAHRGKCKGKNQRGMPTSRFVRQLGAEDQVVDWVKPKVNPRWMSKARFALLPQTLRVREIRHRIVARGMRTREVTIVTTLLDPVAFPKDEITRLYALRWEIETNFRHIKTTMGMEHLKCKTPNGVLKELMIYVLVYNLVRAMMVIAAERQEVADANRMSFIDAKRRLRAHAVVAPTDQLPELRVNPTRPGRSCPRVKKRRMKEYGLMNKPRAQYADTTEYVQAKVRVEVTQ